MIAEVSEPAEYSSGSFDVSRRVTEDDSALRFDGPVLVLGTSPTSSTLKPSEGLVESGS